MLKGKLYGHPEARAPGKALYSRPTVLHVRARASAATKPRSSNVPLNLGKLKSSALQEYKVQVKPIPSLFSIYMGKPVMHFTVSTNGKQNSEKVHFLPE